jgi:sugar phosphate isomerase/epimerase
MAYKLGLNTGFAVNRYAEPEEWTRIADEAGIRYIQFTADMLNVSLPKSIIKRQIKKILAACKVHNLLITSTFTGAFTRVNHLAHPDEDIRTYWVEWFKRFADLTVALGAEAMGSHFGILTLRDDGNPDLRKLRKEQNIRAWHEVAAYARSVGLKYMLWEPMSVSREQGETIHACRELHDDVNAGAPLPFRLCLDVDHGDLSSSEPNDTDPYAWLHAFADDISVVHLKQSSRNKGGHWPFTDEYNKLGIIRPEKVLSILRAHNVADVDLVLEFSFREREPVDRSAPAALRESVNFWLPHLAEAGCLCT